MRFPLISFVLIALALAGRADDLVPERRMVAEGNTDFYGGDLRSIFDTSADLCVASCLADGLCRAMTYNQRVSACFLKSDVTDRVPYEGALSMRVVEAPPSVLAIAETRAAAVALPPARIVSARARAEGIGRAFPDTGAAAATLRADAVARAGDAPAVARDLALAAAALEDRAGDWLLAADLAARDLRAEDRALRRRARALAADAALNAYLRAESDALAATALLTLSAALEADGEGRATIALLRESFRLDPRAPTQAALERAVGLYGFRVLETRVESDLALPRVCLLFSEPLRSVGFDYTPYLRLPEGDFAVETDARELCIAGVAHGATVDVTLRQGLPSLSGEVLAATVTQQVYIRDRAPSVRFPGRGYVLPRRPDATLPIVTVNTEEVDLALHRVLDRNLVSALRDDLLDRPLRAWEAAALSRDLGETVWTGQAETAIELNRDVTSALPIGEAIGAAGPGVYALTAEVPGAPVATQWFLVSDLGLAGLSGPDGVHGFVRGLDNARPRAGVTVELLARNNARLGTAETDEMGHVLFPASVIGEAEPALLVARTEDDYVYLDLTEAGFDLSDRGVAGRAPPGPIDVFLATERGAYRPGERVHATVLMRDARAAAIEAIPLTAIVTRPDGVAFSRRVLRDAGAGGRVLAVDLPPSAQRGRWRIGIHADPEAPPLATATVLVEDFVPERIDHVIDWSDGPLRPGDVARIGIAARYLYGAPGADLQIEGEVLLRATGRLDAHPGYRFGPASADQTPNVTPLDAPGTTDAEGRATITVTLGEAPDPLAPATVEAVLRLSDASRRPVERRLLRPLTPTAPLIGVRPLFDGAAPEGGTAAFDVIALGRDGARRALPAVDWTLERVRTDYQWYEIDGRWQFEPITRRERVGAGALDLAADEIGRIEAPVAWGRYELTLSSEADGFAVTSLPFSAGWYAVGAGSETPDRLSVALDRARYAPGETATLRIDAETEGEILVTVIAGDVLDMAAISVPAGESEVTLDVTEAWRPGAYVTATLVRPADAGAKRGPERALGLAWAGLEPGPARLGATLAVPDVVSPRRPLPIALTPTGLTEGETVFATIAAVDVGILNLTGHEAPDPEAHYLGQRRLGSAFRDIYGRLIDGHAGRPGALRSGGDGGGGGFEGPPPTEAIAAFFAGPLTAGADGTIRTSFDLPDFNGTLRIMAVVWSESGTGQAAMDVEVRDPVVVTAAMPRFLAPGDRAELTLDLAHVSGPAGPVSVAVRGDDTLALDLLQEVSLPPQGRARVAVPLAPDAVGDAEIEVAVTLSDGRMLTKALTLGIRRNDPVLARQSRIDLVPGAELTLDQTVLAGLAPDGAEVLVSAGALARFDVPGLLRSLDTYPYGCTEQVTSRTFPLLWFAGLARALDLGTAAELEARVAEGIQSVLGNQRRNGAFGLWSAYGAGGLWLDAYATDFLTSARDQGHDVPEEALAAALRHLRNRVNAAPDFENGGEGLAYALHVLAREGEAAIGDLRYYADAKARDFATPLALAQIGAALAAYGDPLRADAMFRAAGGRLETTSEAGWRPDFGSGHRDRAAVLTLALQSGSTAIDTAGLARRVAIEATLNAAASTQDRLWSLAAANMLLSGVGSEPISLNGAPLSPPAVRLSGAELASPRTLRNDGSEAVETVLTVLGVPTEREPAQGNGYQIDRAYFDLEGAPVDPSAVALGTRLVAVVTVRPERDSEARLMVEDPLPAGFDIENPALLASGDVAALDWLALDQVATHTEFTTDRFRAAVDWRGAAPFRLGYLVRATAPGAFAHPAASVVDMYRPAYRARTDAGRVTVTP